MSVYITLGGGNVFGIDEDDEMFIQKDSEPQSRIYLGEATQHNLSSLKMHMDRLKVHMKPK